MTLDISRRYAAATAGRPDRPGLVVAVLGFCGVVVALMQTLIVPLVPILPQILGTSAANASWAVTATLLAGAVVTPIAGRLGDMYGKRLILVASLVSLTAGSLVCAVSSTLAPVVAGRVLQGAAMGAIALGISIMRDELPPDRVGSAIAIMSATMGIGGAVGIPVAATIAEKADWHALFWASAGLGVTALVAVLLVVPESPVTTPARFDHLGALGMAVGLLALLLPITKGGDWGWTSPATIGSLAGSVVVFGVWGRYQLRRSAPLVDLRVSARPQVLFTNLASISVGFAMFGMSLVPTQILMAPAEGGHGPGLSMIGAGLVLAPSGLVMFAFSPISAAISARYGARTTLAVGAAVLGSGYLVLLAMRTHVWQILLATMIIGAGIGLAFAAMPALVMGAVPVSETAAANGLNSLMRAVGTSSSAAVIGVVLAHLTVDLGDRTIPSSTGFTVAISLTIAAAAVTMLFTLFIPRHPPRPDRTPTSSGE